MRKPKPIIIVHGGAGDWPSKLHERGLSGVRKAADRGFQILSGGGSAFDAVEAAIVSLEDDPVFNAGRGSTLNLRGEIETDAAIMEGRTLRGAGVALLRDVKNPIKAARIVFEKTGHVLIAGPAARELAIANGLDKANLRVPSRVKMWKEGLRKLESNRVSYLSRTSPEIIQHFLAKSSDTVGALCLDSSGNLAAGCSTGGVSLKLPGRIGDSAILGAGLYADNSSGAATATGIGEQAMRLVISKAACDLMKRENAPSAAAKVIRHSTKRLGVGMGMLTLDTNGGYGVAHNTRNLCWAAKMGSRSSAKMSGNRAES
ncbi:MAG TPA: isoaspartyl peptidase/L-asparaginase family protein [Candidatus Angelobacter sp.]|nr:isoaspartyl peptidase/L-asparaginase family protein [Candidatus Angelobacter sp.]